MYKFYGEKNKEIKSRLSGKILFRFDTKGEFITDDEILIERAKSHFDYIEMEAKEIGTRVKVAVEVPKITIVNHLEENTQSMNKICKYCNKTHEKPIEYATCARKNKEV